MAPTVVSPAPQETPTTTSTISKRPSQSKPKPKQAPPLQQNKNTNPNINANNVQKKAHRSGKPIINWFQRKLGGTVKAKRVEGTKPKGRVSKPVNRAASSPLSPSPGGRQQLKIDAAARRKTVSLNEDDGFDDNDQSVDRHSDDELNSITDSAWSPNSVQEADEDASLRPLPPSSPPSPSPSRSSSSYLSDPRTFKSLAASTKPTTLLSIDIHGNGMAHIAQAPPTPTRLAHVRSPSTATNSNQLGQLGVPPSPQSSSRPESVQDPASQQQPSSSLIVQAPLHTTHHPRNNPRPSSPPLDDASMYTLASSAYGIPGLRVGGTRTAGWSSPPSAVGGGDSFSMSHSNFGGGESTLDDERWDDRDVDASLRALRPRSTRRGSWESEASRWSARVQGAAGRERSLWTGGSVRTGGMSTENVDKTEEDNLEEDNVDEMEDETLDNIDVENEQEEAGKDEKDENENESPVKELEGKLQAEESKDTLKKSNDAPGPEVNVEDVKEKEGQRPLSLVTVPEESESKDIPKEVNGGSTLSVQPSKARQPSSDTIQKETPCAEDPKKEKEEHCDKQNVEEIIIPGPEISATQAKTSI